MLIVPPTAVAASDPQPSWNASPAIDGAGHLHLAYETPVGIEYGDDAEYGFLKLTVDGGKIRGEYVGVTPGITSNAPPQIKLQRDTFKA